LAKILVADHDSAKLSVNSNIYFILMTKLFGVLFLTSILSFFFV